MGGQKNHGDSALLSFLVRAEVITVDVVKAATAALGESTKGLTAIEWLVQNKIVDEEALAQSLAEHLRIPYVNLAVLPLDPSVTGLLKEDVATRYRVVPLRLADDRLVVATANPLDREALHAVEFASHRRVRPAVATLTAIVDALQHAYHMDQALTEYLRGVTEDGDLPVAELSDESTDLRTVMRGTTLPPVIKLSNLILIEGIRNGASDIHIEARPAEVLVRYRIDGILEESFRLPKWVHDALVARCKVAAKLDITERRVPQDGRLRIRYQDRIVDLRMSSLPTQFGEKLTMRILDPTAAPRGLDKLGFTDRDMECIRKALARPEGMVLVTGPTGSGKTSTLYGMLAEITSPTRNIVTIENPIEYQLRGVNQVEINEKQGLTFAGTLRSILRQDPDVILVGEIRDRETAEIALRASQTGHLVLSTLHTNDTVSTVTRLIDLGIEPYMVASSLHLVLAQRLLRRVCDFCKKPVEPDSVGRRVIRLASPGASLQQGQGCQDCRSSGYAGRLAVFEVMPVSRGLAKLIETKALETELRTLARADGMRTLAEDAAEKAGQGLTTAEEVQRVVDLGDASHACPNCQRSVDESYAMCPHCGTSLQLTCGGCKARLQPEWQVCPYCGTPPKVIGLPPLSSSSAAPARAPAQTGPSKKFRVLVVDDEPDFRRLLTLTLERSGLPLSVEVAASGREALACVDSSPPDLILLDLMMPEMDGFEVCERLRGSVRSTFIPILMLTALDDSSHRARGFMVGTDDYLGKPFDRTELVARVRRLIERTYGLLTQPQGPYSLEFTQ